VAGEVDISPLSESSEELALSEFFLLSLFFDFRSLLEDSAGKDLVDT
jgi:hypothetical protein